MYCRNCGNKLNENSYVCLKCGVLVDNNGVIPTRMSIEKKKNDSNVTGILSIIFSSLAVLDIFDCLTSNISSIGMYTKLLDRFIYLLDFVGFSLTFMVVGFILSLIQKNKTCNKVGLGLSLLALFLILTEVMVVIFY
ncbi:MAG: hypothetical protein ACI310_07185 [Bacilli bacterium]